MGAAIQLYRSLGFSEIPAYYSSPIQSTIYFELVL
jgi:ribosomal protein S18 acetylase RimI-like enzyme